MKKNTIESRLMTYFTVMICIFLLILYTVFVFGYYYIYRQQVEAHLVDVETLACNNVEGILEEADQLSVRILSDPVIQESLTSIKAETENEESLSDRDYYRYSKTINETLRSHALLAEHVSGIRIVTLNNASFTYKSDALNFVDEVQEELIYQNNGREHWFLSHDRNRIYLSRAILSLTDMKPLGYLIILYENKYLCSRLGEIDTAYSGHVYLISEDGEIVSAPKQELIGSAVETDIVESREKSIDFSRSVLDPASGKSSYYYSEELENTDWHILITVQSADIWNNLVRIVVIMGIIAVLLLLICSLAVKRYMRSALEPTKKLLACMNEFGDGKLDARMQVREMDELGQISMGYNQMADKIQNLLEQVYTMEIATKEAEIDYLKMQINPHFLYNTLDTISWLGFKNGNEDVSNLAVSLAKMLRFSSSSGDFVLIRDEISCIRDYLEIQEYRFKDRFCMEIQMDDTVQNLYMPKFLLQPLVENSFKHGLEGIVRKGNFLLEIHRGMHSVHFLVKDDGAGISEERLNELLEQCRDISKSNSIGLKNVYRRLYLLYGDFSQFEIVSRLNEGMEITFRIPIIEDVK